MRNADFDFQPKGFTPFKGRTLAYGQTVKVYRNLHKHCYSVVDAKSGLVLGYIENITLSFAQFKVSDAGRRRVLQEQRKNVHAHVIGTFEGTSSTRHLHEGEAYYNPYKTRRFMNREKDGTLTHPVLNARVVTLSPEGVRYTGAY